LKRKLNRCTDPCKKKIKDKWEKHFPPLFKEMDLEQEKKKTEEETFTAI
jgi:hypothetical protein